MFLLDISLQRVMERALSEARNALERGEVPIGCAIQNADGEIIAVGSNRVNELGNATAHAELVAFEDLPQKPDGYSSKSLTLYVTCEPCVMCAAAIVQLGIVGHIVYGCSNPRFGGCGTVKRLDMYGDIAPEVEKGVMASEAVKLLGMFYERSNPNAPKPKKRRLKK